MEKLTPILAAGLAVSLILSALLFGRIRSLEAEISEAQSDLVEIESGTAFALAQLSVLDGALSALGPDATGALDDAIAGLDAFGTSTLTIAIDVDETVPINTEFALNQNLVVPIQTSIPINQTIETTITVDGPLGTQIPLDISVPVNIVIPIDLSVPIAVNETIPVNTTVPLNLAIPVEIDIAETELAAFTESLRAGLVALRDALGALAR